MYQLDYFIKQRELEIQQKKLREDLVTFGKQFIGKNLQDCLPEIAKDFPIISIYRGNVTFKTFHTRRKKNQLEITHGCRLNKWHPKKYPILCKEFQETIKDITIDWCNLYDDNNNLIGSTDTLKFILDDSEEFIIEDKV